ncbi:hypothetical protein N656DRAFT_739270 [Canariomyces notabilis]|uniref:Protamine P1 n=1 Tax=Canariomyces notabilis TaxID=2074819 RepID=A0AAN6QEE8_9PEZI|nr:hypothetical protein N656DRAFT_739270 [Canariomyces arenarius]
MNPTVGNPDLEWFDPERFCNEPLYCEATHTPDDVLYSGSDDEAYHSPTERRARCEIQARRFLEGKPVFLLSASLRGPFDSKSGWVNPWRSRSLKSSSRTKSNQPRRRTRVSKRAADCNGSSGVVKSSIDPLCSFESALPQDNATHEAYIDDETFSRVWNWRDKVVAAQETPQTEVSSPDSKLATQATVPELPAAENGPTSSPSPVTPTVVRNTSKRHSSVQEAEEASPRPQVNEDSTQTPARNHIAQHVELSATARDRCLLDVGDLSPPAAQLYAEFVLSRTGRSSIPYTEEAEAHDSPSRAPPIPTLAEKENREARNVSTPSGGLPEATVSSVKVKTQLSARTDGSFRYKRKDRQEMLKSSRVTTKLSGLQSASEDSGQRPNSRDRPPMEGKETLNSNQPTEAPSSPLSSAPTSVQEVITATAEAEGQPTPENLPGPEPGQTAEPVNGQPPEPGVHSGEGQYDASETASQVDGPTLVCSGSSFDSEHHSTPSLGNFSFEKHSQDVVSEAIGSPRRLLWPKSQRRIDSYDSPMPMFGLGQERTPTTNELQAVAPSHDCSTREDSEIGSERASGDEEVLVPHEGQPTVSSKQVLTPIPGDIVQEQAEPMTGEGVESDRQSEKGEEDLQEHTCAEISDNAEAEIEMQLEFESSKAEIQSPWAKEDAQPLPRVDDVGTAGNGGIREKTDLVDTQSPWTKDMGLTSHATEVAEQLPLLDLAALKLSFTASKALELAASQSPWARGDSQLQLQHAAFNPLSSPANSAVLPTATHPVSPFQDTTPEEDIEMCNSQLCPLPPSTPETKQSGLPTPDFTFPVKSFRDFMTPSPERPAKKRRISAHSDSHLPSTQALLDAAVSNPWTGDSSPQPKRAKKHVFWAPLPDEEGNPAVSPDTTTDPNSNSDSPLNSPTNTDLPPSSGSGGGSRTVNSITKSKSKSRPRARPTSRPGSPPPSILITSKLPTDTNQKFAKHFAAVLANRRVTGASAAAAAAAAATQTQTQTPQRPPPPPQRIRRLLPSESQQVCPSPAFDAMAEAFRRADSVAGADGDGDADVCHRGGDGRFCQGLDANGKQEQGGDLDVDVHADAGMDMDKGVDVAEPLPLLQIHPLSLSQSRPQSRPSSSQSSCASEENQKGTEEASRLEVDVQPDGEESHGEGEVSQEQPIDDVSAVLENLDDFIGGIWDLDAELASMRTSASAQKRRQAQGLQEREGMGVVMSGASLDGHEEGLIDVGVWD